MDTTINLERGQIVRSKKGRDEGKVFVITDVIDENYLYLVDGKLRKLNRPKKKKVKHVYIYNSQIDLDVNDLNDSYIRKELLPYS